MAIYTTPGNIGSPCPQFQLKGVDGHLHSLSNYSSAKALVVMFICNHCPYVQAVEDRILVLARELSALGANIIAISSNDEIAYPEDSYENMKNRAQMKKYSFPYLHDSTQEVAKAFGAVCTPDFFVYDRHLELAYRGRLDDSWKDPKLVTRHELRHAVLELLQNRNAPLTQYPSMGCSIKWRA